MATVNRYHISLRKGEPMECNAKPGGCPFADEANHYDSREDAMSAFESKQSKQMSTRKEAATRPVIEPLPRFSRVDAHTVIVPADLYVLGDPQLIFGDDNDTAWEKWLATAKSEKEADGALGAQLNGQYAVALKVYDDSDFQYDSAGREFHCESGFIGLVPVSALKKMGLNSDNFSRFGTLVSIDEPIPVYREDGVLSLGDDVQFFAHSTSSTSTDSGFSDNDFTQEYSDSSVGEEFDEDFDEFNDFGSEDEFADDDDF